MPSVLVSKGLPRSLERSPPVLVLGEEMVLLIILAGGGLAGDVFELGAKRKPWLSVGTHKSFLLLERRHCGIVIFILVLMEYV